MQTITSQPLPPRISGGACLNSFDTKAPATSTKSGYRSRTGRLERREITCVKPTPRVFRTVLTPELVNDQMADPVVATEAKPMSLEDFSRALFQASKAYDVSRVDKLLASASQSTGEIRVCSAVVDRVIVRAWTRVSIISKRECNQIRSLIAVFVHHNMVSVNWCLTVENFFKGHRTFQDQISVPKHLNPAILRAELLKAADTRPAHVSTVGFLSRVEADEELRKIACEVIDLELEKRLSNHDKAGESDYELFKGLINIYLCRGIWSETTLGNVIALSALKDDYRYAQVLKEDFGASLQGPLLFSALRRAADEMDGEKIRKILDLSGAGEDQLLNQILGRVLVSVEFRLPLTSVKLSRLYQVIDALVQYGALERFWLNKALRLCVLGEADCEARVRKSDHESAIDPDTLRDILQKTVETIDHEKAELLLDLIDDEPSLREPAGVVLVSRLQPILLRPWQPEFSEQLGLWQFMKAFSRRDIIDAQLLSQALTIFQRSCADVLAEAPEPRFGAYLKRQTEVGRIGKPEG